MKGICVSCAAFARRLSKRKTQSTKRSLLSCNRPPSSRCLTLGQLVATPGALTALGKAGQNAMEFLSRHVTGDWGDIPEEDRKENQYSLEHGFRLLSSYRA